IEKTKKWVTEAEMTTFETAIKSATDAKESKDATAKSLNDAKTALDKAVEEFNKAIKDGTKEAPAKDTDSKLKTFTIAGEDVLALSNIDTTGAEKNFADFTGDKVKGIAVEANSNKAKSIVVKVNGTEVKSDELAEKVLGENDVITVVVTAEDSTKTTTYTVTVVK
ncbi:cadherin-like beta sandwich domain-containing protein, partial [Clostridium botulinum]